MLGPPTRTSQDTDLSGKKYDALYWDLSGNRGLSLAFGTDFGRFFTQYLAVPFGGSYLMLAFLKHVWASLTGAHDDSHGAAEGANSPT